MSPIDTDTLPPPTLSTGNWAFFCLNQNFQNFRIFRINIWINENIEFYLNYQINNYIFLKFLPILNSNK